ncbi:MAG: LamG domain-containing protein [Lentisphaerae bacterium]|nr:LamG domain-containing protein [Lentisphaerota bacterium]
MGSTVTLGTSGKIANAYEFSGNKGHVRTELVHDTTVTISAWGSFTTDADGMLWSCGINNPDLYFSRGQIALNTSDGLINLFCDQPENKNEWHHYVTVIDNTAPKARLYIDGLFASDTANYRNPSKDPPFTISRDSSSAWTGKIDEFRTANVVRSAAWIWASWKNQGANDTFNHYGEVESNVSRGTVYIFW